MAAGGEIVGRRSRCMCVHCSLQAQGCATHLSPVNGRSLWSWKLPQGTTEAYSEEAEPLRLRSVSRGANSTMPAGVRRGGGRG